MASLFGKLGALFGGRRQKAGDMPVPDLDTPAASSNLGSSDSGPPDAPDASRAPNASGFSGSSNTQGSSGISGSTGMYQGSIENEPASDAGGSGSGGGSGSTGGNGGSDDGGTGNGNGRKKRRQGSKDGKKKRFGPEFVPLNISATFIRRPVATTLLTMALALAGMVAFKTLPVAPLPQMDFPMVFVRASLPGASPEVMATTVATPLERALGRIAGVTEMTSSSSQGSTHVMIQFELDRDINGAARDVQAAINAARSNLPTMPSNPSYRKVNPSDAPILVIALTSETISSYQMYDMAQSVLAQKIAQVPGVGEVNLGGGALPSVRVNVNPQALFRNDLTMADVDSCIRSANVFMPRGLVDNQNHYWLVGVNDQIEDPKEYGELIVSTSEDGGVVRLKDIAEIEMGPQDIRSMALFNNKSAVLLMIFKAQGANIIETVDRIKALVPSMRQWVTESVTLDVTMDRSITIRASLTEVEMSLLLSMGLVILAVFLFLRNNRATSIPAVAAPVSLIGTFAVMYVCGYTLDNLSLMALTIATGFVVDDAIVVLENIVRRLEKGESPLRAALNGSREVGFTIISITLSLVAVFIPILLMPGTLGSIFREFAVVLSVAVLISMVVSLTTTPMMCAQLLRSREEVLAARLVQPAQETGLIARFKKLVGAVLDLWSRFLDALRDAYGRSLAVVIRYRKLTLLAFTLVLFANVWLYIVIPKGFFPQQDTGIIMGGMRMDQSLSFQAGAEKLRRIQSMIREDPAVDKVSSHYSGGRGSSGMFITLVPLEERGVSAQQVIDRLRPKLMFEPGVQVFLQPAQDLRMGGRSSRSQYQYTLQGDDITELRTWSRKLAEALQKNDILQDVDSDLEERGLETVLTANRNLMGRYGVTMQEFDNALGLAYGQSQISTIYKDQNQYKVVVGYTEDWWQSPDQLEVVRLPGDDGLVPLRSVADIGSGFSSLSVAHQGQFAAVTISFNLATGYSLSDAQRIIEETQVQVGLPNTIIGSFQGTAKLYSETVANELMLILAAILVLYVVLGILYESLIHPLTILSTLPPAGGGALIALMIFDMEFSIIALIGVLLLCGLVKKNAILMIDFALTAERNSRMSPTEAILTACRLRFRPIMMTTFAAMFGAVPLAIGQGDGAELRQPLGIAIVGGLALSQLLTLYTTPVIFLTLDTMRHNFLKKRLERKYGARKARLLLALRLSN